MTVVQSYGVFRNSPPTEFGGAPDIKILVEVNIEEQYLYRCYKEGTHHDTAADGEVWRCEYCEEYWTYPSGETDSEDERECAHCDSTLERIDGNDEYEPNLYCNSCEDSPVTLERVFICGTCGMDEGNEKLDAIVEHINDQHLDRNRGNWSE